jgi:uncharacterized membrane protein
MMFFALVAVWFLFSKRWILSFIFLALSIATKEVTAFLLPAFLFFITTQLVSFKKIKFLKWLNDEKIYLIFILLSILGQFIGTTFVLQQRELQPWYFLWLLPFIVLLPQNIVLTASTIGFSLGLLLRYAPFLYFGDWGHLWWLRNELTKAGIGFGILAGNALYLVKKLRKS